MSNHSVMTPHLIPDTPSSSEMSELIRAKDWSKNRPWDHPRQMARPALRSSSTRHARTSGFPMAVRWGPEFIDDLQ